MTLGGSHDGGVDGVVPQDRLGIDRIYFQAKRWNETTVGAGTVRDFVGALAGMKAKRGVFITSSKFSNDATSFASSVGEYSVILIDGERLADLMYEYEMGATTVKTYLVKRIDSDFFDDVEEA
jgi:restriction system protein